MRISGRCKCVSIEGLDGRGAWTTFVDFGEVWGPGNRQNRVHAKRSNPDYITLNFIPHTISPFQACNLATAPSETAPIAPEIIKLIWPCLVSTSRISITMARRRSARLASAGKVSKQTWLARKQVSPLLTPATRLAARARRAAAHDP